MSQALRMISLLLLTTICLLGCSTSRKEIKSMKPDGVIFLAVPSQANDYYAPFFEDILSFHEQFKTNKSENDHVFSLTYPETGYDDIWIRDVAPIATTRLVKFVYAPQNLSEEDSQFLDASFTNWLTDNQFEISHSPLVLDGGNFIWNRNDTVILTTRILEDNAALSQEEIIAQLKSDLDVTRIILIPPEPGDVLAHADGMVKFIDENTLFISDFLGDDAFRQQVEKTILAEMPSAKFVVLSSAYTDQGQYDEEIASAKGLYINLLETDSAWYLPQFQLPEDKAMLDFITDYTEKPVIPLKIASLSTMGGAINCLTWYCPTVFLPAHFQP